METSANVTTTIKDAAEHVIHPFPIVSILDELDQYEGINKDDLVMPVIENNGRYFNPWSTWSRPNVGAVLKWMTKSPR
jgi:hypothetical protein